MIYKITLKDLATNELVEMEVRADSPYYAIGLAANHPSCPVDYQFLDCVSLREDAKKQEVIHTKRTALVLN